MLHHHKGSRSLRKYQSASVEWWSILQGQLRACSSHRRRRSSTGKTCLKNVCRTYLYRIRQLRHIRRYFNLSSRRRALQQLCCRSGPSNQPTAAGTLSAVRRLLRVPCSTRNFAPVQSHHSPARAAAIAPAWVSFQQCAVVFFLERVTWDGDERSGRVVLFIS